MLLEQFPDDRYKIRATVRSLKNSEHKLEPLRKAYGDANFNKLEFVEADLLDHEALTRAVEGCDYIIHLANPLPGTKHQSDEEMVKPAQQGT